MIDIGGASPTLREDRIRARRPALSILWILEESFDRRPGPEHCIRVCGVENPDDLPGPKPG
jgi:hypothetical protein